MADTALAESYSRLLRAIGYSVGGELLVSRVKKLVDVYVEKRKINSLIWRELVGNLGRKTNSRPGRKSAADHMADMYSSLGFLVKIGNQLFPGPALDSLSMLKRDFISGEAEFDRALKALVCFQILERDGDIFVNCLAACFQETATEDFLNEMLKHKRKVVADAIKSPGLLKRVLEKVSIRNLESTSKQRDSSDVSPFAKRTTPLMQSTRTTPVMGHVRVEENISKDYLKKSPARRKRWAEDIGLWDKKDKATLSDFGHRFLQQLEDARLNLPNGGFAIWAYEPDLLYLRVFPGDNRIPKLLSWDFCEIVAGTYGKRFNPDVVSEDLDECYEFLLKCKSSYSEGNELKGSIRHQVPISIAQSCLLGLACAEQRSIANMHACLELESRGKERRFNKANIRGTEGAIEVRSKR